MRLASHGRWPTALRSLPREALIVRVVTRRVHRQGATGIVELPEVRFVYATVLLRSRLRVLRLAREALKVVCRLLLLRGGCRLTHWRTGVRRTGHVGHLKAMASGYATNGAAGGATAMTAVLRAHCATAAWILRWPSCCGLRRVMRRIRLHGRVHHGVAEMLLVVHVHVHGIITHLVAEAINRHSHIRVDVRTAHIHVHATLWMRRRRVCRVWLHHGIVASRSVSKGGVEREAIA